jgi:hypothetical protein
MPLVSDAFNELLHRIELNPTRVRQATTRYNAVKGVLEKELSGATVKRIGSFQRSTKIRPVDLSDRLDIDALAILGEVKSYAAAGQGMSPQAAIQKVRRALSRDKTYQLMDPQANAPVVFLEYADDFHMEIAVGFADSTGTYLHPGGTPCYLVARADGWRPADYDYDAEYISDLNQRFTGGALVPLIKLVKRTFRTWQLPLESFHTEILVATIAPTGIATWIRENKTWGYHHALAYFLSSAHGALTGPISLPGSYSPRVDSGLGPSQLTDLGKYLKNQAADAWKICGYKEETRAIHDWYDLIGAPFPVTSSLYG